MDVSEFSIILVLLIIVAAPLFWGLVMLTQ